MRDVWSRPTCSGYCKQSVVLQWIDADLYIGSKRDGKRETSLEVCQQFPILRIYGVNENGNSILVSKALHMIPKH